MFPSCPRSGYRRIYSAAFFSSPRNLKANLRPIASLSIGLVLLTTLTVALVAHLLVGLPWAAAFVLGAIVSPTEPLAATAIAGRLGAPHRDDPRRRELHQRRDRAGCGEEGDGYEERSLAYQRFRQELLGAERAELLRLRGEGRISDEVRRRVEWDLEDARLEN